MDKINKQCEVVDAHLKTLKNSVAKGRQYSQIEKITKACQSVVGKIRSVFSAGVSALNTAIYYANRVAIFAGKYETPEAKDEKAQRELKSARALAKRTGQDLDDFKRGQQSRLDETEAEKPKIFKKKR